MSDRHLDQRVQEFAGPGESPITAATALEDLAAQAGRAAKPISVEQLERDDGAPVIYIDALDIAVFVYVGHCDDPDAVVIDTYRRTDAADRRLNVLLDGARAHLLTLDPARFHLLFSLARSGALSLVLTCGCCAGLLCDVDAATLGRLVDLADSHRCPTDPDDCVAHCHATGDESREAS